MKIIRCFFFALLFSISTNAQLLADELDKADAAVANVLFEYDGSEEYASYKANEDGSVDLIFASNTPDDLYEDIITQLQNHPEITSVLASQGGPACKAF
ncbi:MAG: hypothetical protein KAT25_02285 [Sulfuriflexus sp.]|nr:hypothetical protein [Sulfuriflexus sp.]